MSNQLPDNVARLAAECGFSVRGWDGESDDAIITGKDVEYLGSKAECIAYMTAWQQCQNLKISEVMKPTDGVKYGVVGFYYPQVPAGGSGQCIARPQVSSFRGYHVAIPDHIADDFIIEDIRVGNVSTYVTSGGIPGSAFATRLSESLTELLHRQANGVTTVYIDKPALKEFGRDHSMPVCLVAMDLIIQFTNISAGTRNFRAFIAGKYA